MSDSALAENPLTENEERVIDANAELQGEECPDPECEREVHVVDLSNDGTLYVSHVGDGAGLRSRSDRGETDGCRITDEQAGIE